MQSQIDIVKYADLLARLAYDDDFRARFEADPRAVLKTEMGIDLDPGATPIKLPPKEVLQTEYRKRLSAVTSGPDWPMSIYA